MNFVSVALRPMTKLSYFLFTMYGTNIDESDGRMHVRRPKVASAGVARALQ